MTRGSSWRRRRATGSACFRFYQRAALAAGWLPTLEAALATSCAATVSNGWARPCDPRAARSAGVSWGVEKVRTRVIAKTLRHDGRAPRGPRTRDHARMVSRLFRIDSARRAAAGGHGRCDARQRHLERRALRRGRAHLDGATVCVDDVSHDVDLDRAARGGDQDLFHHGPHDRVNVDRARLDARSTRRGRTPRRCRRPTDGRARLSRDRAGRSGRRARDCLQYLPGLRRPPRPLSAPAAARVVIGLPVPLPSSTPGRALFSRFSVDATANTE